MIFLFCFLFLTSFGSRVVGACGRYVRQVVIGRVAFLSLFFFFDV